MTSLLTYFSNGAIYRQYIIIKLSYVTLDDFVSKTSMYLVKGVYRVQSTSYLNIFYLISYTCFLCYFTYKYDYL